MTECDQPIIITTPIAGPYIKKLTYAPVVNDTIFSLQYNIPSVDLNVPMSVSYTSSQDWPYAPDGYAVKMGTEKIFAGYDINEVAKIEIDPIIEFEVGVEDELSVLTQMPSDIFSLKLTKFDFTNATISLTNAFSYDLSGVLNTMLAPIANDGITFSISSEGVMEATIPIGNVTDSYIVPMDGKFSLTFDMDLNFDITLCIAGASFGLYLTIGGDVTVSSTSVGLGEVANTFATILDNSISVANDVLSYIPGVADVPEIPTSNNGTIPAFGPITLTAAVSVNLSELVGG